MEDLPFKKSKCPMAGTSAYIEATQKKLEIPTNTEQVKAFNYVKNDAHWEDPEKEHPINERYLISGLIGYFMPKALEMLKKLDKVRPLITKEDDKELITLAEKELDDIKYLQALRAKLEERLSLTFGLIFGIYERKPEAASSEDLMRYKCLVKTLKTSKFYEAPTNTPLMINISGFKTLLGSSFKIVETLYLLNKKNELSSEEWEERIKKNNKRLVTESKAFTPYGRMEGLFKILPDNNNKNIEEFVCQDAEGVLDFTALSKKVLENAELLRNAVYKCTNMAFPGTPIKPAEDTKCPAYFIWDEDENGQKENILEEIANDVLLPLYKKYWIDLRLMKNKKQL